MKGLPAHGSGFSLLHDIGYRLGNGTEGQEVKRGGEEEEDMDTKNSNAEGKVKPHISREN